MSSVKHLFLMNLLFYWLDPPCMYRSSRTSTEMHIDIHIFCESLKKKSDFSLSDTHYLKKISLFFKWTSILKGFTKRHELIYLLKNLFHPPKKGFKIHGKKKIGIRQNKVDIVLFSEVKSDTEQGARQGTRNPIKEIRSGIKLKRIYL